MNYRWHKYKFVHQTDSAYTLFNFLNKAIISINRNVINGPQFDNSFKPSDNTLLNESLIRNSFIIPAHITDEELLRFWFNSFCENNEVFEWLIVLTKQCNFKCSYCFQLGDSDQNNLAEGNWLQIKTWLCSAVQKFKPKYLNVVYFGGEPTLEFDLIEDISSSLSNVCLQNGTEWRCEMVSNGYLLNKDKCDVLVNLGLKRIQITLDGPPNIHNTRRPLFKESLSTFDEVLNSIIILSKYKEIECVVRINLDLHNYEAYTSLLDILCEKGIEKLVLLNIVPTQPSDHKSCQWNSTCFTSKDAFTKIKNCHLEAAKRGFRLYIRSLGAGPCISITKGGLVFESNGNISKCHHLADDMNYVIGNILNGVAYSVLDYSFPSPFLKCTECRFVPLCMGGCRYEAVRKSSNINSKICNKIFKNDSIIAYYLSQYDAI